MRGSLLKGDAYIHITPDLSKAALLNSQRQRLPLLRPARKRLTQPVVGGGLNGHMDGILPGTVMLNAIALAVLLGANRIVTLGFDVPAASTAKEIGGVRYAKGLSPLHRSPGFDLDEVSLFLSKLRTECDILGVPIYNCSPLTEENVLAKKNIDSIY